MNRSDKLSKLPIEKRLMSVFRIISLLLSATGIIACVAMGIVSYQYSYALRHYGFAQGDIGKAMIVIAEMRSETRAAIGYDDDTLIAKAKNAHDMTAEQLDTYISVLEDDMITDEGRATYQQIKDGVASYQQIEAQILELGTASDPAKRMQAQQMQEKYQVAVLPVNCEQLKKEDISKILQAILYEFPVVRMNFYMPKWVEMLELGAPMKQSMVQNARKFLKDITYIKDLMNYPFETEEDYIEQVKLEKMDLAAGSVNLRMDVEDKYYYENMSELTGVEIHGEYQLISMVKELAEMKKEYEKVEDAMNSVKMKGYGVVNPGLSDITLEEPVLIKHGNKYGVKMKAVSPSIHMIKANIETEVAPIVGSEEQANDLIAYIKDSQNTEEGVWSTNIFGKSIGELMEDGIRSKISMMDDESQLKLQDTMQKIVNDSNGGLVCIII